MMFGWGAQVMAWKEQHRRRETGPLYLEEQQKRGVSGSSTQPLKSGDTIFCISANFII
jgi:hypothetical protein